MHGLSIGRSRHEVLLELNGDAADTIGTITLAGVHLPNVLTVIVRVGSVTSGVVRHLECRVRVVPREIELSTRDASHLVGVGPSLPIPIASKARSRRRRVLGGAVTRIRRRQRGAGPRPSRELVPCSFVQFVGTLITLVLCDLLLAPNVVCLTANTTVEVGLDGSESSQSLASSQGLCHLLTADPVTPVAQPGIVVLGLVEINEQAPVNAHQPVSLQLVQLRDGYAGHFGPRPVLEGVVVEELAAKQQGDGQHSPDLSLMRMEVTGHLQTVYSFGEVVHAEENGCFGETRRGQNLRAEFAEGTRDGRPRSNQLDCHLGNVFSHHVDLIVEDSANTSTRHIVEVLVG